MGYFALYLIMCFLYAALCPPAEFAYDLSLVRAIVLAACSSVSLWQLHERRQSARAVALVTVALCVILSAVDVLGLGALADVSSVVGAPLAALATSVELFGAGCVTYALVLDDRVRAARHSSPRRRAQLGRAVA